MLQTTLTPNRIWLGGITYIPAGEGWLYLAAVLDLATRKIVGWAMRDHMRTELALSALLMAVQRQRPEPGLICHSDRGSQYAAEIYRQHIGCDRCQGINEPQRLLLRQRADGELLFHTLKVELAHQRQWETREEAKRNLFAYIETYYHRARIHSAIGYVTPEHAERLAS